MHSFVQKYRMCVEAGAVGVIIVNREDAYLTMPVTEGIVSDSVPFVLVTETNGARLMQLLSDEENDVDSEDKASIVTLESGRGIAAAAPIDGFSVSSPLSSIRMDALKVVGNATDSVLPFAFVRRAALSETGALLIYDDQATYHVVLDGGVLESKAYADTVFATFDDFFDEVFSFNRLGGSEKNEYLIQQGLSSLGIFTLPERDPLNPVTVSNVTLDNLPCGRNLGNVVVAGDGNFLYVTGGLVRKESDACSATIFEGINYGAVRIINALVYSHWRIANCDSLVRPVLIVYFSVGDADILWHMCVCVALYFYVHR